MITVFAHTITSRLQYIFKLYFEELLQVPVGFTDNIDLFEQFDGIKLNYSKLDIKSADLVLRPHDLLFQSGIQYQNLTAIPCGDQLCFLESSSDSFLPFDPFAAGFFLVSRYEEYLEKQLDKHYRYQSRHSVLSRNNALQEPVVNQWAQMLAWKIKEVSPGFQPTPPYFDFLTTIDIDNAWAFKNKSLKRIAGATVKNMLKGDSSSINNRYRVLSGKAEDPYDSYDYIQKAYKGMEDYLQFFFLLGNPGMYDRNIPPSNKKLQKLIQKLSAKFNVGIHPSYGSDKNEKLLRREIDLLHEIIGKPVLDSRQHYLKLELPESYIRLTRAGIKNDFTMGYADNIGFRAGIASPFFFYDLKMEEKTPLLVFPFQTMDVVLRDKLNLNPEEALEEIRNIMLKIKKSGGTFISLWHNESLGNQGEWDGWRQVFEETTKLAVSFQNESR